MKKSVSGWVVVGLLAAAGCNAPPVVPASARQAGSLGIATNGQLFVAELDNDSVAVVDPNATSGAVRLIPTGARPEKLIVRDNTVFVANRQSRTVTQIDAKSHQVIRQIAVGSEPMGMDTQPDGTLLVSNAMSGTLQAIDPKDGSTKWTTDLGEQIRTVAALPDGRIFVPSYKNGVVHVLDSNGKRTSTEIAMVQPVPGNPDRVRQITSVEHILVNPLDGRVYLPHSASLDAQLPPAVVGYYSRPPPASADGISASPIAPAVTTVNFKENLLLKTVDERQDFPPPVFTAGQGITTTTFAGPKVAALDFSGKYLFIVNQLSNNIVQVSTVRGGVDGEFEGQGVKQLIPVGQGPDGIALSNDNKFLYVNNAYDHSISVLSWSDATGQLHEDRKITDIAPQTLTASQQRGRILFNSANDPRVSKQGFGGVSCASCHPGGREDGHTWKFAEGARNTPALVGRQLAVTAPYHWDGALTTPESFSHVVETRMGGTGLRDDEYEDVFQWLENEPSPDNPNRQATGLTPVQQAGQELFKSAGCVACHNPDNGLYTDNKGYDVGTAFTSADIDIIDSTGYVSPDLVTPANPNTPSLLGVFASAPYLHDGSFKTLEDRIRSNPNGKHGVTAQLSDADIKSLAEYVKTL
jgi:YVTN family beta-propeller protein